MKIKNNFLKAMGSMKMSSERYIQGDRGLW